jgi:hypothetical protein
MTTMTAGESGEACVSHPRRESERGKADRELVPGGVPAYLLGDALVVRQ